MHGVLSANVFLLNLLLVPNIVLLLYANRDSDKLTVQNGSQSRCDDIMTGTVPEALLC